MYLGFGSWETLLTSDSQYRCPETINHLIDPLWSLREAGPGPARQPARQNFTVTTGMTTSQTMISHSFPGMSRPLFLAVQ